jgi:hypothetical protein
MTRDRIAWSPTPMSSKMPLSRARKLNDAGNSVTVSLPKHSLETFGILTEDGLRVDEADPYVDVERGVIGIEVKIPDN